MHDKAAELKLHKANTKIVKEKEIKRCRKHTICIVSMAGTNWETIDPKNTACSCAHRNK